MCLFTNSPTNPVCGANRRLIPPRMSESSSSSSSWCCSLVSLSLCRTMPRSVLLLLSSVPDRPPARNATPPPPRRLRAAWRRRAMCASSSASSSEGGVGSVDVFVCGASGVDVVWSSAVSSDRWWRKIFRLFAGRKRMGTAAASGSGSWEGMLGFVPGVVCRSNVEGR